MPQKGPYGQIILFGDSITQNSFELGFGGTYGPALANAYKRRLDVINRGFSGYNTDHAVLLLDQIFPTPAQAKVELLIICFGANDACRFGDPTHHVPLEDFRDNLTAIINHPELQAHKPSILLVTPPPIDEHMRFAADSAKGFNKKLRRTQENTQKYADICHELGEKYNLPVADLWKACMVYGGWKEGEELIGTIPLPVNQKFQGLFNDGLHLSGEGYKLFYDEVMGAIQAHLPHLDPDKIPFIHPTWDVAPKIQKK